MTNRPRTAAAAAEFLKHALAAGDLDVRELEAMAKEAGLLGEHQQIRSAKLFRMAKRSLGIQSVREGFGRDGKWTWHLPVKAVRHSAPVDGRSIDKGAADEGHESDDVDPNRSFAGLQGRFIPKNWLHGIARLDVTKVPQDIPAHRWRQFVNDCHKFLLGTENWAERATALGWDDRELFGCSRRRPLEHAAALGLVWAINGGTLVELRRDWAVVERAEDRTRRVHHRERPRSTNITLPWVGLR